MAISLDYQQAILPLSIAYGLPFAIQVFYVRKKFEGRAGNRSKVLKFFWTISLILLALALTPITREYLYPSSNLKFHQNEIYRGVLLIICTVFLLAVGYLIGFFVKDEKTGIAIELQTKEVDVERLPSLESTRLSTQKSDSILSNSLGSFIRGFKDGMKDTNSNSKAAFFNVNGGREEKKSRTLSDYLWQSIISILISAGCAFGIYLNLIVEINLLISIPCIVGFVVFFVLAIIYAVRFKQLVDEKGISIWDFFWELLLLAAFGTIALVIVNRDGLDNSKKEVSETTYDFYSKVDFQNCNSPFSEMPISLKFKYKKDTNEIFRTSEFIKDGVKKSELTTLDNCSILDANNWSCGGEWIGGYQTSKYTFVNGELSYDGGSLFKCPHKIVKR